ncbi:type IV secretion protein Rhs [Ralstonia solanacearum]|nr:type IV secretion protein Rhs [Ralstonia solanacearum]
MIQVVRPGGVFYDYNWDGINATAASASTRDALRFSPPSTGNGAPAWAANGQWTIRRGLNDETERYDADGVLRQIQYRNGQVKSLTYSDSATPSEVAPAPGYLIGIADTFGKSLSFRYDSFGRLATLIDPTGQSVSYGYELVKSDWTSCTTPGCFRIKTVTYQDGQTKTYNWDEADYTSNAGSTSYQYNLLTGITDENGQRYSTIRYDSKGQAVSTELAGGVYRYTFSNVQPRASVTVTDPLGTARTFNFVNAAGLTQLTSLTGAPCDGCGPASATYDSNGNVASQTDFNGNVTCYGYNLTRNLETMRVEGLPGGTACPASLDGYAVPEGARKISTQWHPVWRQPIQVAEPKQITTYVFNGDGGQYCAPASAKVDDTPIGVVCKQTVQATNDANGSLGFGATAAGLAKTTQWTYDGDGQVLTIKGPRTDINDQIGFSYRTADDTATPPQYRRGDLYQITDALGHTTTISQLDGNGRPLRMTDANGVVTTFTYAPRGWLTSQTTTPTGGVGQTTSYDYDAVGQLTKVTLPDGSSVSFSYDGAHRLTGAADSQGNSISYTLDAMGNHTQEQAKDPNGNLSRQVTRVFDSMNRPLKVTVGTTQ